MRHKEQQMNNDTKHVCWNCGCDPAKARREHIATAVLAGMFANRLALETYRDELAQYAIAQADALIAALDSEPKTGVNSGQNEGAE